MRLDHSFTVPVPVESAWQVLLDVPRIAPCMPGATLTGVDGDTFTGTVKVKLGPIALTYQGKGRFVERDEAAHRVVIEASGRDTRSAGTASATVTASLAPEGGATRVDVATDLTVTGKPAQFGRGMIADVSAKLIGQFADCVAQTLTSGSRAPAEAGPPAGEAAAELAGAGATSGAAVAGSAGGTPSSAGAEGDRSRGAGPGQPTTPEAAASGGGWVGEALAPTPEAEPIDLLRLTGSTATARRLAGYGLAAVLLAVLVWMVARALRR
jgi:carbon monoxide dehydrogenase subunit G